MNFGLNDYTLYNHIVDHHMNGKEISHKDVDGFEPTANFCVEIHKEVMEYIAVKIDDKEISVRETISFAADKDNEIKEGEKITLTGDEKRIEIHYVLKPWRFSELKNKYPEMQFMLSGVIKI